MELAELKQLTQMLKLNILKFKKKSHMEIR